MVLAVNPRGSATYGNEFMRAVIGDWGGASAGLGGLMKLSGPQFQTARVFAAIVVLSVVAITLFSAIVAIEKWSLRKYPSSLNQAKNLGES